ncbi:hypothetical protein D3C86_1670640 [compost metagenome]
MVTADKALFEQHFQRFACSDAGDAQGLAQMALRRHGLFGFPLAGMDRRFQIACQLQVQRRGLGVVGAQGL